MIKPVRGIPKGVDCRRKRLANGSVKTYWFLRELGLANGRLPGGPGDPEFYAEYARKIAAPTRAKTPENKNTLSGLITIYRSSRDFRDLADKTRRDYDTALEAISTHFRPDTRLSGVLDHPKMRRHIEEWHAGMSATPRKADLTLAVLHRLLEFGVRKAYLERNCSGGIKRLYQSSRAALIWTPDQIEALCASASKEVSCAVKLAYATGQRQGDLLKLTWNDVCADGITFRTSKTGLTLFVPMYDELRVALNLAPRVSVQVVTGPGERPWRSDTFRHEFSKAYRVSGIQPGLHFHDLRGSALKAFADAGCSDLELRAISGHSMKSLPGALGSYIVGFRSLAESAVRKRENANRTRDANQSCKLPEVGGVL